MPGPGRLIRPCLCWVLSGPGLLSCSVQPAVCTLWSTHLGLTRLGTLEPEADLLYLLGQPKAAHSAHRLSTSHAWSFLRALTRALIWELYSTPGASHTCSLEALFNSLCTLIFQGPENNFWGGGIPYVYTSPRPRPTKLAHP